MKKSRIATLLVFFLLIPATLFLGTKLPGRTYYITGTLIILELMIPFFMAFFMLPFLPNIKFSCIQVRQVLFHSDKASLPHTYIVYHNYSEIASSFWKSKPSFQSKKLLSSCERSFSS